MLVEVCLQVLIRLHPVGMHELLNLGIFVPRLFVNLVTANVKVSIGKEPGHFADEFVEELVSALLRRVHYCVDAARLYVPGVLASSGYPTNQERLCAGTSNSGTMRIPRSRA